MEISTYPTRIEGAPVIWRQRVPRSVQQVLTGASERSVDSIMLPEALFEPFKDFLAADGRSDARRSVTCPIVVITAAAIGSSESLISDSSWFL